METLLILLFLGAIIKAYTVLSSIPSNEYTSLISFELNKGREAFYDGINQLRKVEGIDPVPNTSFYKSASNHSDIPYYNLTESSLASLEQKQIDLSSNPIADVWLADKPYYMSSQQWYKVKSTILKRDSYQCVKCSSTSALNIHHITYKNFTKEQPEDLVTLCRTCHHGLHKHQGYTYDKEYPVE